MVLRFHINLQSCRPVPQTRRFQQLRHPVIQQKVCRQRDPLTIQSLQKAAFLNAKHKIANTKFRSHFSLSPRCGEADSLPLIEERKQCQCVSEGTCSQPDRRELVDSLWIPLDPVLLMCSSQPPVVVAQSISKSEHCICKLINLCRITNLRSPLPFHRGKSNAILLFQVRSHTVPLNS